ncbi:hypothetical protein FD951_06620 [Pseudomonas chlororaphis subsp. aurantiaca]|nr:hypothetical protein FD951_06620 [Pseudomonas chlororaphis subsp. aurantiaca]
MARQRHKRRARYLAGKAPVIETGRLLSLEQVPTVGLRLMENARSLRRGFCRVNRRQRPGRGNRKVLQRRFRNRPMEMAKR